MSEPTKFERIHQLLRYTLRCGLRSPICPSRESLLQCDPIHVLAESLITDEPVVDTQEFSLLAFLLVRDEVLVIPLLLPVAEPVGSPFLDVTSFASRLCGHTPTVACWCRCPCVSFVTARIPRASPAIAGQRGERVEDPSSLSPAYPCFARPRHTTPNIPFPTSWRHHHRTVDPTPQSAEGPSATTPNLGLSSHWQTEATSEATLPGDLPDHPGPDPHCTRSKPTLTKPTLARPTLVKTDFGQNRLWPKLRF